MELTIRRAKSKEIDCMVLSNLRLISSVSSRVSLSIAMGDWKQLGSKSMNKDWW